MHRSERVESPDLLRVIAVPDLGGMLSEGLDLGVHYIGHVDDDVWRQGGNYNTSCPEDAF